MLLSQHVINVENCEWAILHYFFTVSLQNLTCVLHLECSSIWTNHISTIGQPPVASSYHIRPHRSSSFKKKKQKKKKPFSANPIRKSNFCYLMYDEFSLFKSSSLKRKHFWEISINVEAGAHAASQFNRDIRKPHSSVKIVTLGIGQTQVQIMTLPLTIPMFPWPWLHPFFFLF